jgi:hypothetical protein
MRKQRVTVTLADPGNFDEVVADLRAKGLDIEHSMKTLGIVTGSLSAKSAKAHEKMHREIASLAGVKAVEAEGYVDIGPPGSSLS